MEIQWFEIGCEGRTDLIMARYVPGTEAARRTKKGASKVVTLSPREIAARALWLADDDETVVIPRETMHRAIVEAGKFFKAEGRRLWSTSDSSLLPGVIEWGPDEAFPVEYRCWEVDLRGCRVASGGRKDIARPIFDKWAFAFEIGIDTDEIHPSVFRDIVDAAGRRVGIGAMRPERKGLYGQFRVVRWNEIEEPDFDRETIRCKKVTDEIVEAAKSGTKKKRSRKAA